MTFHDKRGEREMTIGMFMIGLYIGVGCGWAMFALAEVGFGRGWALLWRVPFIVMFWPLHFVYAIS